MQNLLGIINSVDSRVNRFESLTNKRPDYMLPYGARYRIIDFTLSNISNYNLSNVMLFGGRNIRSTLDHIGNGKSWELNRRNHGLSINPPSYDIGVELLSEIKSYYNAIDLIFTAKQENIYVSDPMTIAKINIDEAYEEFLEKDYDIMFVYKNLNDSDMKFLNTRKLILDGDKVVSVGENLGTEVNFNMFINNLFIKKSVFIELISKSIEHGNANTLVDAIELNRNEYKIGAYKTDVFVEMIRDAASYYQANLNLLKPEIYEEVFYTGGMILTKSKDEPSTLYKSYSKVGNSLVANGCIIEGHVENSIIFRGVNIGKNTIIKNSVLIQQSEVGDDAVVINSILDKYATIDDGVSIMGTGGNPYIVAKNERIRGN